MLRMKIKEMEYGKERRTELLCKDKYKNYNYYVLNLGTHTTAYIEIPKESKLYRKSYDEIYKIGCDIDVVKIIILYLIQEVKILHQYNIKLFLAKNIKVLN